MRFIAVAAILPALAVAQDYPVSQIADGQVQYPNPPAYPPAESSTYAPPPVETAYPTQPPVETAYPTQPPVETPYPSQPPVYNSTVVTSYAPPPVTSGAPQPPSNGTSVVYPTAAPTEAPPSNGGAVAGVSFFAVVGAVFAFLA